MNDVVIIKKILNPFVTREKKKKLINKIGIDVIMDNYSYYSMCGWAWLFYTESSLGKIIYKIDPDLVKKYFQTITLKKYDYYGQGRYFLKDLVSKKLKHIAIENYSSESLLEIIKSSMCSEKIVDMIFDIRYKEISERIILDIQNECFEALYRYLPQRFLKEVIVLVNDDIILKFFKNNEINDKNLQVIYDLDKDRIGKLIFNHLKQTPDELNMFLNANVPRELIDDFFLIDSNRNCLKNLFFNYYLDKEAKTIIYEKMQPDIDLSLNLPKFSFEKLNTSFPDCYILKALNKLHGDEEILKLFLNSKVDNEIKTFAYKNISGISNILYNSIKNDSETCFTIILAFKDYDLLYNFTKRMPTDVFFKSFKYFPSWLKDKFYVSKKNFVKKIIKNAHDTDCDYVLEYLNDNYDVNFFAFSLLNSDELFNLLFNYVDELERILDNLEVKKYCLNLLVEHANEFKEKDFEKFIIILDNVGNVYSDDIMIIIENSDLNLDDYLKIFSMDNVKIVKKLVEKNKKDDILELIVKKVNGDFNIALEYLYGDMPDCIIEYLVSVIKSNNSDYFINDFSGNNLEPGFVLKVYKYAFVSEKYYDLVDMLIDKYIGDKLKFVKVFNIVQFFLQKLNVDENRFWQYCLNSSYDYLADIVYIVDKGIDDFLRYLKLLRMDNINIISSKIDYSELLRIVKNYCRFSDLSDSILKNNVLLTEKEINNLKFLFNNNCFSFEKYVFKSVNDCENVKKYIKNELIQALDFDNVIQIKEIICETLFHLSFHEVQMNLSMYGRIKDLVQLEFNNRYNLEIIDKIQTMEVYVDIMECISYCNDLKKLKTIINKILENFDKIEEMFLGFDYTDLIRQMYAYEIQANLTTINEKNKNYYIEKEMSQKYEIPVYNLKDKQYVLLAHVKSFKEDLDELINGVSSGTNNFISLSAISHRNQKYYYDARDIIFGYDFIPVNNFICSSDCNIGSNYLIKSNCSDFSETNRIQRGTLDISDTEENSEILCFREGLKPKYIIVPEDYPITFEMIEIAKKYGLAFILTQKQKCNIQNPILNKCEQYDISKMNQQVKKLTEFKDKLISANTERKIAIMTDSHALFESTLAVLEDAKKNGVTEIYSLGDNIGTGPNPREVVQLLKRYNVKSIKGNHEKYCLYGLESFKNHLLSCNGYEEAFLNSTWTRNQLDDKTLEEIEKYPDDLLINYGNKNILLCHSFVDYNTFEPLYNIDDYDFVFAGHEHFRCIKDKVFTLRGLGIGDVSNNKEYNAYYVILSLDENGNIEFDERLVPFDYKNTFNNINCSDVNTKDKIRKWVKKN